jgi:hypothetical protein
MPTLRSMIDNTTIFAGAPKAIKPSPAAQHVADHMNDPLGATKEGFSKLTQSKLEYDQQREEMQRQLSMPQAVINHVSQVHGLQPNSGAMNEQGQPGMMGQPNPDDPDAVDENGNPLPPGGGGQSAMPGQMPGAMPKGAAGAPLTSVGQNSRPPLAGQPGQAPGPAQSTMPPKLGVPQPGKQGMTPKGSPMGQPKVAAKPKGAGQSFPKAPGSGKVASKNNKAQNNSARQIKVHVTASTGNAILSGGSKNIESHMGMESLRSSSVHAGGPGSGRHPGGGVRTKRVKDMFKDYGKSGTTVRAPRGAHTLPNWDRDWTPKKEEMEAGLDALNEKSTDTGNEESYNPVVRAGDKKCENCGKFHAEGKCMKAGGPGSGRKSGGIRTRQVKEWAKKVTGPGTTVRAPRGAHALPKWEAMEAGSMGSGHHGTPFGSSSKKERDAHRKAGKTVARMKTGGPGSGRHSSGITKVRTPPGVRNAPGKEANYNKIKPNPDANYNKFRREGFSHEDAVKSVDKVNKLSEYFKP